MHCLDLDLPALAFSSIPARWPGLARLAGLLACWIAGLGLLDCWIAWIASLSQIAWIDELTHIIITIRGW